MWYSGYLDVVVLGYFGAGGVLLLLFFKGCAWECGRSGGDMGLESSRSQPERLLVLWVYLLQRSVYIFMQGVSAQPFLLQASVDARVNMAGGRSKLGADRPQGG